jgi:hypothetical protein
MLSRRFYFPIIRSGVAVTGLVPHGLEHLRMDVSILWVRTGLVRRLASAVVLFLAVMLYDAGINESHHRAGRDSLLVKQHVMEHKSVAQ